MKNQISITQLRADIYRIVDRVLAAREPIYITRKSGVVKIVPADDDKLTNKLVEKRFPKLKKRNPKDILRGDPKDLVNVSWESEWRPDDIS